MKSQISPVLQTTLLFLLGVLIAGLFAIYLYSGLEERVHQPNKILPKYKQVPDFSLTDSNGRTVTNKDLKGHFWVADFIFTTCPSVCPMVTSRMRELQTALRRDPTIKLVSFSVDPKTDTPPVLKTFATHYMADPQRWYFLTGPEEVMANLILHGFILSFAPVSGDQVAKIGAFIHSTKFAVVDRDGMIRSYRDGTDEKVVDQILEDLGHLMHKQPK